MILKIVDVKECTWFRASWPELYIGVARGSREHAGDPCTAILTGAEGDLRETAGKFCGGWVGGWVGRMMEENNGTVRITH